MAKFETDENLGLALSPLQDWSRLEILLIRHRQFLQHPFVGLQPIADHSAETMAVDFFIVVEFAKALQGLSD